MNHEIVPAGPEHVAQLAPRLRKGDLREIAASSGGNPEDILLLSVASSTLCWAWLYKGKVMAMFGAAAHPTRPGVGIPWLLAASGAHRHRIFFVRQSRKYVEKLLEVFPFLENYVDCRNTVSIQWLDWCGFAMAEVHCFYGIQRLPFIRFCLARRTPPSVT